MSAPSFPQEICDLVIDALHSDPRALAACSFVSRSWLATARVHKFRTVRLRSPEHCARLERLLNAPLLDSGNIARNVRDVWFGVDSHDTSAEDVTFQNIWQDDQHLEQLLLRFTRLRSLQLENVRWAELPRGATGAIFAAAPKLACLHLIRVVFLESDSIIRLLLACSTLHTLRMSYVSWLCRSRTVAEADAAQRDTAKITLKLERITLEPSSYSALFSAAALYTRPIYVSAETLEWATSERPRNVAIRAMREAEAIDVYRRILSQDTFGDENDVPIPMERTDAWISSTRTIRVDISTPAPDRSYNSFAIQVPALVHDISMHDFEYDLGTFLSDSFQLDVKLSSNDLDDALSRLVARRREIVVTFRVRIQLAEYNSWWADAEAVMDHIATQFSSSVPKLLALRTRVGIVISFFDPDGYLAPHPVWKEVWWTAD